MPTESDSDTDVAVSFRDVSKRFRVREGATVKEFFPALLQGKAYGPALWALKGVAFDVMKGETLGIIGRNGSGKSTALKLMAGILVPSEGEVLMRGRVCPLLDIGTGFHPDLSGRENLYLNAGILGMTNDEIKQRFSDIVDFAELWPYLDMPVKRYSSGMYLRLAFGVAVHSNPDVLLVDESLAVGDAAFQAKCMERMSQFPKQGVAVILVSHNLALVESYCSRAILLESGRIVQDGEPGAVIAAYKHGIENAPALSYDALPGV